MSHIGQPMNHQQIKRHKPKKNNNKVILSEKAKRHFEGRPRNNINIKPATKFDQFVKTFHAHAIVTKCETCDKNKRCAKLNITPEAEAKYHCLECVQRSMYERGDLTPKEE